MEFARAFRRAVQCRGLSLHALRARLRDRGYDVSVSTLSMWQSGVRHPGRSVSLDIIRELETLVGLSEGELASTLGPPRRVRRGERRSYAALTHLPRTPFTEEVSSELCELSDAVGAVLDANGRITHTVNRTLWQARIDGARDATVFFDADHESTPPEVSGTLGCSLVDVAFDPGLALVRSTLRLDASLTQGSVALTERRSVRPPDFPREHGLMLVAPRRQAEVTVYAVFDPAMVPSLCRVTIDADGEERSHHLALNGTIVTHTEFDFGPGIVLLDWEFRSA